MKKIKLFLAAMAAMVSLGINAQSWTASEVGAGDFVLYNVGTSQYFTKGNGWGTQASITTNGNPASGMTLTLSAFDGNYKLGNGSYGIEHLSGGTIYTDQSRGKNSTWTFTQVGTDNGPVYNIISAANHGGGEGAYMTAGVDGTIVTPGSDGTIAGAKWKLLPAAKVPLLAKIADYEEVRATVMGFAANTAAYTDEVGAANTLTSAVATQDEAVNNATTTTEIDDAMSAVKAAGNTFLESVIITAGFDITNVWITNPAPGINGNLSGWTNSGSPGLANQLYEYWNVSGGSTKQTLTNLPKGAYKLTAIAYTRDNMAATLYAGSNTVNLVGCGSVNDRAAGSNWIAQGNGVNELNFTLDAATESLEIGLIADNATGDHWMCWRSFTLTYYGDPINMKKAELAAAVATAQAIDGNTIPTAAKDAIDAVVTTNNQTWSTEAEYDAAVSAINTAVSTYASAEIVTAYLPVIDAKAMYNQTDYTDKDGAKATFKALIDAADATTNLTDLNAAIVNLKAGLTPFISTVTLDENAFFDVTNFFVVNPSVSQNTTGWTIEGTKNGNYSFGVCNYGECEFYNTNFKFYQTLSLTPGTWEFGVTGFHRAGNHSTYFYAGEDKILIPGVTSDVVNTMAAAQTYFDNGNGKVALKFLIEATQNVEIGIDNQDTQTDKWTIFRDFTLKYYGAPNYSVYDDQWNDAVTAANEALDDQAYKYVSGSERTAVTEAIEDAPDGSNKANYLEKIQALEAATATFKAAAPSYNAWVLAKTATKNLWGSALGVADPTTAAEAAAGVNALNVAQYNKVVTDYPYSLNSKIGEFNTWTQSATSGGAADTPQTLNTEHWSAATHVYYEQGVNGWGANNFTVSYSKTTNLPAGSYVIKVATRASSNVTGTISSTATENTVAIANVGAASKGITTDGVASFDEGTFAKNGEGYGWQWRFLPFTVAEAGEVTITIEAASSSQYGWVSIADGELRSVDNIATAVNYNETSENDIVDEELANVTVSRAIKEGYNTVCLPFDLTEAQVYAAFGTGSEVYSFSDEENTDGNVKVNFNKVWAGTISANVPVLVKATAASTAQEFSGVQVVAGQAKVEGKYFDFVGVYAPTTVEAGDWFIGNGALYKSAGTTNINAFRAYLDNKGDANVEARIFIEGVETTGIEGLMKEESQKAGAVYDLQGRKVANPSRGLYIINGKKVVIK